MKIILCSLVLLITGGLFAQNDFSCQFLMNDVELKYGINNSSGVYELYPGENTVTLRKTYFQ